MSTKIHYAKPSITDLEVRYATDAAKNGWGSACYEYIVRFEEAFQVSLGVRHAIATSSCTGALHMGLAALSVGPGDEVILADSNWIASAAPIVQLGATPVFVDVLEDTWCIDPQKVKEAITPRTKAIIAVHLYGNLCEMKSLLEIGELYGVEIVEDSAEAMGSFYHGASAGSIGKFGVFSFHGTKTMTTGEGGMFVTSDTALFEKVLTLSNHGRSKSQMKQFWPDTLGFKYKMSNIQAAIGCAQLERIDELIESKRRVFQYYKKHLEELPLRMNPEHAHSKNGYWMPTVVLDRRLSLSRDILIDAMKAENIDARVFFWPLSSLSFFPDVNGNLISKSLCERGLNLPSYFGMTEDEQDRVIQIVKDCVEKAALL